MLTTLLHSGLGDVAAVVTRYYGGVKLGTGGLARAYAGAVNHALDSLPRTERVTWASVAVLAGAALPSTAIAVTVRLKSEWLLAGGVMARPAS